MKKQYLFFALFLFSFTTYGQSYGKLAADMYSAVNKSYAVPEKYLFRETIAKENADNGFSYLWPLCGLLQAGNELDTFKPGKNNFDVYWKGVQQYYVDRQPAAGYSSATAAKGYSSRFYDDNQWLGIALMDAYFRTKKTEYKQKANEIYRFMLTGYDDKLGGGLYWKEDEKTGKNTCSNGPGILLALQLYKASKQKKYLDTAMSLYKWANKNLRSPQGIYYDNISIKTGKIDKKAYSYNTATMLESNVYLYELIREKKYLTEALFIADHSLTEFYADGKFTDGYWFNAVMLRAYQHLLKIHPDKKYVNAFERCVQTAINNDLKPDGLMGKEKEVNLVNQSGMLEIMARMAELKKQGK